MTTIQVQEASQVPQDSPAAPRQVQGAIWPVTASRTQGTKVPFRTDQVPGHANISQASHHLMRPSAQASSPIGGEKPVVPTMRLLLL